MSRKLIKKSLINKLKIIHKKGAYLTLALMPILLFSGEEWDLFQTKTFIKEWKLLRKRW